MDTDKTDTDIWDKTDTDKPDKCVKADKTDTDKPDKMDETDKADNGWNIKNSKMYDGSRGKIIFGRIFVQFWCQALPFTVPIQLWVLLFMMNI